MRIQRLHAHSGNTADAEEVTLDVYTQVPLTRRIITADIEQCYVFEGDRHFADGLVMHAGDYAAARQDSDLHRERLAVADHRIRAQREPVNPKRANLKPAPTSGDAC